MPRLQDTWGGLGGIKMQINIIVRLEHFSMRKIAQGCHICLRTGVRGIPETQRTGIVKKGNYGGAVCLIYANYI